MTPSESISIPTQRLTLRFLNEADLPAAYDIFSHPEVMRYWSYSPWTDRSQAELCELAAPGQLRQSTRSFSSTEKAR